MNWETMTPEQRDTLIHTEIMKRTQEPCHDGQLDPYMGGYWQCSCGWVSDFFIGNGTTDHTIPIPRYTQSMDAAWLVVRMMNNSDSPTFHSYQGYANFIDALEKIVGSNLFFDLFYCDKDGDHLTPERICKAALQAKGVEI